MGTAVLTPPLDALVSRIVAGFSPVEIILFGSRGRGDERLDSDFDLLIVLDEVGDRRGQLVALQRLTHDLPLAADFVLTTRGEIAESGHVAGTILRPALREGKILYRRDTVNNAEAALRWLRYAEEDGLAARSLLADESVAPRHACCYAQQMAEKALKSALAFVDIDPPKSHNLDGLRNMLPPGWEVQRRFPRLEELTIWNAAGRYPANWPEASATEAREAVDLGAAIVACVRDELVARGIERR